MDYLDKQVMAVIITIIIIIIKVINTNRSICISFYYRRICIVIGVQHPYHMTRSLKNTQTQIAYSTSLRAQYLDALIEDALRQQMVCPCHLFAGAEEPRRFSYCCSYCHEDRTESRHERL